MDKLLPCPHCNFEVEERVDGNTAYIECTDCGATWGHCGSEFSGRFKHWNTRHIPKGYVLVPKEPTEDMMIAWSCEENRQEIENDGMINLGACYRAMIAASILEEKK